MYTTVLWVFNTLVSVIVLLASYYNLLFLLNVILMRFMCVNINISSSFISTAARIPSAIP